MRKMTVGNREWWVGEMNNFLLRFAENLTKTFTLQAFCSKGFKRNQKSKIQEGTQIPRILRICETDLRKFINRGYEPWFLLSLWESRAALN